MFLSDKKKIVNSKIPEAKKGRTIPNPGNDLISNINVAENIKADGIHIILNNSNCL